MKSTAIANAQARVADIDQPGLLIVSMSGRVSCLNSQFAAMVGENWTGVDMLQRVVPEDLGVVREWLARPETASKGKLRFVGPEGRVIPTRVRVSATCDADGFPGSLALLVTPSDADGNWIRSVVSDVESMAHIGTWEVDLETREVTWSGEMYRIAGLDTDFPVSIEVIAALASRSSTEIWEVLRHTKTAQPLEIEQDLLMADGSQRTVRLRAHRAWDGRNRIVGTAQDVTEAREAMRRQERLQQSLMRAAFEWRMTFDSFPAVVVLLDDARNVLRLNAAALALSRFTDYRDALGRKIEHLGPAPVWGELRRVVEDDVGDEPVARKVRDSSGLHWDVVAREWSLDGTACCTVFANEVTDIIRLQESLRRSERMSAVGSLLANVAHEVRNPLFAISATVDAIEAKGTAHIDRFMSSLRAQVNRMSELMQDLLEYGRPASEFEWGDLSTVLSAAQSSVRPLAEASGVTIDLRVECDLRRIWMDRRRLIQVFENLLRNAVQHSPSGGKVQMRTKRTSDAVEISVADRGPGFHPEDLSLIFMPFYTRRRGGTGLGLSLAERIVEDHNGSIHAANATEGGAVMTVSLPIDGGRDETK